MTSRSWAYTLNNYTEEDVEWVKRLECKRHRCGKEVGEEKGTPHLQGYIVFKNPTRLSALKKLHKRVHWEPGKSNEAALNYCAKGEIVVDIDNSTQGKRTDLEEAVVALKEGGLQKVAEDVPTAFVKYSKGLTLLKQQWEKGKVKDFPTEVIVFWGPPGCGKSRRCRELCPDLYSIPEPINGSVWFDGYEGEDTILLDDFYGWIKYHTMLQWLDRYPVQLPVKGAFVWRNWTKVLITSNMHPENWYNREECDALMRRITKIEELTGDPTSDGS